MGYTGRQPGRAISVQRLSDPFVLSLQGDANGHVTIDASQDVTINTAVQDDSHNHVIGNVDGLQTTLDSKANTVTTVLKSSSTGAAYLPVGTSTERPVNGIVGMIRCNTETGSLEFYDGSIWVNTNLVPTVNSVTGTIYAGATSNLTINVTKGTDIVTVRFSEGGSTIADVTDVVLTSGSGTVAVPSAVYGQTAGDTIAVSVLNQDGTPSINAISKTVQGLPTGGTITTSGGYRYHTFTTSSSFVVPSGVSVTADYLIVAGGGGGGTDFYQDRSSGGGGGGGMLTGTGYNISNSFSVTVGGGGAGGYGPTGAIVRGLSGSYSSAIGLTAIGGGGGGGHDTSGNFAGLSGGSGGGGTHDGTAGPPGSGTSGQGYNGGGAGISKGGAGAQWLNGSYYAGGGGGSSCSGFTGGGGGGAGATAITGSYAGGVGGGGDSGSSTGVVSGTNGTENTGGGGGASRETFGGNGGKGIVIIRYPFTN